MKKLLKLALLVFAITAIAIGCKKDEKNPLIGTWIPERISVEVKFSTQIDPFTQLFFNAFLNEMMSNLEIGQFSYQFGEGGKVIMTDGTRSVEGTYTAKNNILTVTVEGETISGPYSISGNKLEWSQEMGIQDEMKELLEELLDELDPEILGPFGDLIIEAIKNITEVAARITFVRQ